MPSVVDIGDLHLTDPRIIGVGGFIRLTQKSNLLCDRQIGGHQRNRVKIMLVMRRRIDTYLAPDTSRRSDECSGSRGLQNALAIKVFGICIPCLLARQNAYSNTEIHCFRRSLDDVFFLERSNG